MPRVALGNVTIEGLKKDGFLRFSEGAGVVGFTLLPAVAPEGIALSDMEPLFVTLDSIVNVTEAGVREVSKGMNPNEALNNAVSELANLDLDDDALLALIKARRDAKAKAAATAATAATLPGTEPDETGDGTDNDELDIPDDGPVGKDANDPGYAAMNPKAKRAGK